MITRALGLGMVTFSLGCFDGEVETRKVAAAQALAAAQAKGALKVLVEVSP
jgi:hypothetical protein